MPNIKEKLIELFLSVPPIPVFAGMRSGKHCEKHGSCDGCLLEWFKQPAEVK